MLHRPCARGSVSDKKKDSHAVFTVVICRLLMERSGVDGRRMSPSEKTSTWECPRHRFRMRIEYHRLVKDDSECVALEETIFNSFSSPRSYRQKTRHILHNLRVSPVLPTTRPLVDVLLLSEEELASGTIVEVVSTNEKRREEMLTHLMKEKMADIDEMGGEGPLRCKTCGSSAVVWDQKQTRSADEVCLASACRVLSSALPDAI